MADLKSKQIKFPLTGTSVVSSSAQIATDISGSFVADSGSFSTRITADSGSFSTRVTTAESELGNTLVSSSAQISTDISGSFVAPSASFSTRVTTTENVVSSSVISSSAQISDDISGSLSAVAVVGLGAGIISGSSSNSNLTTAIVSEGANIVSSSAQVSADISGSFTGELSGSGIKFIGGGVSGSLVSTGSFGRIEAISGSIGNVLISENGTLSGSGGRIKGFSQIGDSTLTTFNGDFLGTSGSFLGNLGVGLVFPKEKLEISGNISGSGSGSFLNLDVDKNINTTNLYGTILTATQATIDHDSLANFVANEHVDHSGVTITAGDGLTGGGTIASTRTLAVGAGTGVTVNANDVAIGQAVETDSDVAFATISTTGNITAQGDIIAENYIVSSSVTFMTSSAISGSSLFGDTLDDTHQFTGSIFASGSLLSIDATGGLSSSASGSFLNVKATNNVNATNFYGTVLTATQATIDHDSLANFVADEHVAHGDVSVIAGTGLTGGGTIAANRTLNVIGGTGVTANANDIAIGQDVATTANVLFAAISASGDISGSQSGSFLNVNVTDNLHTTSGSFDYINATGLMTASGLETSGDIVAFGSSDRELKDNIQSIENPLEKMEKIGGYTFVWNDKQNVYKGKDIGVVAQEIQSVLPEIVATRANGYLGVKYEKIVPLLIESIKELNKKIEHIEENCDCLNK